MTSPDGAIPVLDLRIDTGERSRAARFDLSWQGQTGGTVRTDLADLGIAPSSERSSPSTQPRDLGRGPRPAVVGVLASLVESMLLPGRPLALRFGRPSGPLPILPWERWLTEPLDRPVLRWPYLPSQPPGPSEGPVEIAICSSVPLAKEPFRLPALVRTAVGELRDSHPWFHFHVFADGAHESDLKEELAPEIERREVRIEPASSAKPFGRARRRTRLSDDDEDGTAVESPWLRWLLAKAPPRLDLVLFLCHGYLANGRGYLALAESPLSNRDPEWSRFVGHRQLVTFLDACGARALALASPPQNWSISGLLCLADEVARESPSPALVHDFEADPDGLALGRAVSLLLRSPAAGPPQIPLMPEIALYSPPDLVGGYTETERRPVSQRFAHALGLEHAASPQHATEQLYARIANRTAPPSAREEQEDSGGKRGVSRRVIRGDRLIGRKGTTSVAEQAAPPNAGQRQQAASQRVLERYVADIASQEEPTSESGQAVQEGRARALSYVVDLLKKSGAGE